MKIKIILATILLVGGVIITGSGVSATDTTTDDASDIDMALAPSYKKLGTIEPGESYDETLRIVNGNKEQARNFTVSVGTFWVEDSSYDIKWGISESQYGKIADWTNIDTDKTYEVGPGETYELNYTINVPQDQPGGAQRLMITVSFGGEENEGQLIVPRTALNALVYATVDGSINPKAEVTDQNIQTFSFNNEVIASSTLENTGDVDLDTTYRLTVTNPFTGEISYEAEDTKVLMAETTRIYEQTWVEAPFLGIFNVKQEIELLGKTKVLEKTVFICPLWLVILLAVIIVLIIISIIIKHKERKKNRRIEEKMERAGFSN